MRIKIYQPLAIHELGKRANQEDSIYPIEGKATENDRLFLLCDGMGGHEHGEVASQSICKSLSSFLLQHAVASEGLEDKLLSDALAYAYEELDKLAIAGDSRQMGTTLTLLYFTVMDVRQPILEIVEYTISVHLRIPYYIRVVTIPWCMIFIRLVS